MLNLTEKSTPSNVNHDLTEQAFVARALLSLEQAKQNSEYYSAEAVLHELQDMLLKVNALARKRLSAVT